MGVKAVTVLGGSLLLQMLLVSVVGSADLGSDADAVLVRIHARSRCLPLIPTGGAGAEPECRKAPPSPGVELPSDPNPTRSRTTRKSPAASCSLALHRRFCCLLPRASLRAPSCRQQPRTGRCSTARSSSFAPRSRYQSPRSPDAAGRPTARAASAARRCASSALSDSGQIST